MGDAAVVITEIALDSPGLDQVLALHRGAKRYLGFLPDEGFKDRAVAGTLLGAVAEDRLCGYILYDLPADRVTIRHLCVDSYWQGAGIARLLLDAVSERHSNRLGIQLECRRDYPANEFWPKVGFRPVGERPGRNLDGLPLTKWLRSHSRPDQTDLFEVLVEERALAALDQMVLEDLVCGKPEGGPTRNLLEPWVLDLVELGATDQLFKESNDTEEPELRSQLITKAKELHHLRSTEPDGITLERMASLAPGAGLGDHHHLARAIDAGAEYLLTRDERLLRARTRVESECGIQILRPDQLIADLDRARRRGLYEPVALQGTEVFESRVTATADGEFAAALLNSGARERAHEFKGRLRVGLSNPGRGEVVQITNRAGKILAGFVRHREEGVLRVGLLRAPGRDSLARAVARQLAFAQRAEAAKQGLGKVVVEDSHLSPSLPAALEAEAYVRDGPRWHAQVERGINSVTGVDRDSAAAIERSRWPLKVGGAGLPTYLVAIQPTFAERLFDSKLAEQTLLHRDLGLGLSREHVYYRAPNPGGFISAPARILWYVSGGRPEHPVGELRAVSRLAEVVVDSPKVLCRRFERLGAWTYEQVCEVAGRRGQAMALRVVDTELFDNPLDIEALRDACREIGSVFRPPQSPIKIDESVFELLYRRSSAYVD